MHRSKACSSTTKLFLGLVERRRTVERTCQRKTTNAASTPMPSGCATVGLGARKTGGWAFNWWVAGASSRAEESEDVF